jgi:hypothetical protein
MPACGEKVVQNAQLHCFLDTPGREKFAPDAVDVDPRPLEDQDGHPVPSQSGRQDTPSNPGSYDHDVKVSRESHGGMAPTASDGPPTSYIRPVVNSSSPSGGSCG